MADQGEVTILLKEWGAGNQDVQDRLFELVVPELHRMAGRYLSKERNDHTLQPTELVDQIYQRIVRAKDQDWQNRQHFFAIAGRAMRQYLIDHARRHPDVSFQNLDDLVAVVGGEQPALDVVIEIDRLLNELARTEPEWCKVIELRFFLGLSNEETADVMGLSVRTLARYWHEARKWLFQRLTRKEM